MQCYLQLIVPSYSFLLNSNSSLKPRLQQKLKRGVHITKTIRWDTSKHSSGQQSNRWCS